MIGDRSPIPLRNDEDQVCSRSAQPSRVPVGRSVTRTTTRGASCCTAQPTGPR